MKNQKPGKSVFRNAFLLAVFFICSASYAVQYPGWKVYSIGKNVFTLAQSGNDMWAGNDGGLVKIDMVSTTITFYDSSNSGLPENDALSIAIDGSANKWIGTAYSGLVKFDGANWTVYNVSNSGLPADYILSITIDGNGNKWIGTNGGGIAKFDGLTWTAYYSSNSGLPGNEILSIAIDNGGNKWIGTSMGDGLAKFDGTTWTVFNSSNSGLPGNNVYSIAIDGAGNKWIGTSKGLAKFDGTTWTVYNSSNSSLPNYYVSSVAIDSTRNKWIGTWGGGLIKFDGSQWTVYDTTNSGLPNNYIETILIDRSGNKWVGTGASLAVYTENSAIKMPPGPAPNPLVPLCRNYPDPFRQRTFIRYNIPGNGPVCLRVYSLDGQVVQTLVNTIQTEGSYTVSWDGRNNKGKVMARGVFMYKLMNGGRATSGKMNFIE